MLRRAASSPRLTGALLSQLQSRVAVATFVRYQSGGWIAPKRRGKAYQQTTRRPLVNGKQVAFHVNDLKSSNAPGSGATKYDTLSLFGNSPASIAPPSQQQRQQQQKYLRQQRYDSDLTVVLDLDECLIHSQFLQNPQEAAVYAHQLKQQTQQNEFGGGACDSFRVSLPDGELVHVHVRPGLLPFLRHVTSRYETHIFTAAMEVYAKPVLDYLCSAVRTSSVHEDRSDRAVFAGRWYREHCSWDPARRAYVKDLSKLALPGDIHKTVLIDNNPLSFHANPENGILVNSFYQDSRDDTLSAVSKVLEELEDCPDVRPVLTERFRLAQALESQCPHKHLNASVMQFAEEEEEESEPQANSLLDEQDDAILEDVRPQVACYA